MDDADDPSDVNEVDDTELEHELDEGIAQFDELSDDEEPPRS
jgi:hypothetical protein